MLFSNVSLLARLGDKPSKITVQHSNWLQILLLAACISHLRAVSLKKKNYIFMSEHMQLTQSRIKQCRYLNQLNKSKQSVKSVIKKCQVYVMFRIQFPESHWHTIVKKKSI